MKQSPAGHDRLPITASGLVAVALAAGLVAVGATLRASELLGLAAALAAVLVFSGLACRGGPPVEVTRSLRPLRPQAGEEVSVELHVSNGGRRPARRFRAFEPTGGAAVAIDVPALAGGATWRGEYRFRAPGRGVHDVGPLRSGRADPFGLFRSGVEHGQADPLVVHPAVVALRSFPTSSIRDLEGPTTDLAPEGGIAFHSLREYAPGDDPRLVHWRSTARLLALNRGTLLVRRNVDANQPIGIVVLDERGAAYDGPATFEAALEVAASLVTACAEAGSPVELVATAGDGSRLVGHQDGREWDLLDRLAAASPGEARSPAEALSAHVLGSRGASLVVVSGELGPDDRAAVALVSQRFGSATLVELGAIEATRTNDAHMTVITVSTAAGFARLWNEGAR